MPSTLNGGRESLIAAQRDDLDGIVVGALNFSGTALHGAWHGALPGRHRHIDVDAFTPLVQCAAIADVNTSSGVQER